MHCRNISGAKKGKPNSNNKPVQCIDTGVVYRSTGEAAKILGLQQAKISAVALGKRNHTGGLRFTYGIS